MIRGIFLDRWDYRVGPIREQYSINLYPYPPTLSKVNTEITLGKSCKYIFYRAVFA